MNEIQARVTKWIFRNITTGYTFEDFFKNPQAQIECQLAYRKWCRYNLVCDNEMGLPKNGWEVGIDFQNSYAAGKEYGRYQ